MISLFRYQSPLNCPGLENDGLNRFIKDAISGSSYIVPLSTIHQISQYCRTIHRSALVIGRLFKTIDEFGSHPMPVYKCVSILYSSLQIAGPPMATAAKAFLPEIHSVLFLTFDDKIVTFRYQIHAMIRRIYAFLTRGDELPEVSKFHVQPPPHHIIVSPRPDGNYDDALTPIVLPDHPRTEEDGVNEYSDEDDGETQIPLAKSARRSSDYRKSWTPTSEMPKETFDPFGINSVPPNQQEQVVPQPQLPPEAYENDQNVQKYQAFQTPMIGTIPQTTQPMQTMQQPVHPVQAAQELRMVPPDQAMQTLQPNPIEPDLLDLIPQERKPKPTIIRGEQPKPQRNPDGFEMFDPLEPESPVAQLIKEKEINSNSGDPKEKADNIEDACVKTIDNEIFELDTSMKYNTQTVYDMTIESL